ncbi:hypothetical protein ES332_D11G278400v1 [Gossypium tomentosum]|uniref:Uncharacterized protein n=1 Tax=Gossypium tomentosum TaxID=34277 RepID=A0A5D2IT75_GOSTO|nr:hypothetical protein ES332_D11G278400v1 [Gossypium tomentosum]
MWSLLIHMGFHVPHATGSERKLVMFSATGLSSSRQFERLTYSGISEPTIIFNSPKHFVAYYSLSHLWVPRYLP